MSIFLLVWFMCCGKPFGTETLNAGFISPALAAHFRFSVTSVK